MKYDLSILIPARREEFLSLTVKDILKNKRGKTEVIVVLDGEWPNPPLEVHEDVTIIYEPASIGQRAAQNEAAKISQAKYVMKVDAHCSFDEGFDVKMIEGFKKVGDDVTMVPVMMNLHVFDWVCEKCGERWYMGPDPKSCPKCDNTTDFRKEIVWKPKRGTPHSTSYCFNKDLRFKYFGGYKKKQKGDIVETMSLQGSCFMCTRENYWELGLCDESWGSWGQQGSEVSLKTHLSGGGVVCNKNTFYSHMFRTRPGFNWPYGRPGSQSRARKICKEIFLNNKWDKQIYPLSWMLEKFWPIPHWEDGDLIAQKKKEMESERFGIYRIKCSGNNKIYIGSAKNLSQRFGEHLRRLRRGEHENKHLQGSWDKYGEVSFEFSILRFCYEKDLLKYEQVFIDKYKEDIGWRNMFNMNPFASSGIGRPHSDESKAKMSVKQAGENNGFYGKKHTEESRRKMSNSHKGQLPWNNGIPCSEETKKKISVAQTGKDAWNEGLTKESDERIRKYAEKAVGKPKWEDKEHPKGMLGKEHSEESKRKIGEKSKEVARSRERDSGGKFKRKPSKGICYYTDNQLDEKIAMACQTQLKKCVKEKYIVSASLKPMKFGKNIHLPLERGYLTMFKQILAALEASTADIIFLAEHDVLYHPSHFQFFPPKKDVFYYNTNVWRVRENDGFAVRTADCRQASGLCAYRNLLLDHYRKRAKMVEGLSKKLDEKEFNRFIRHLGFEPGTHGRIKEFAGLRSERWESEHPNVDIRRGSAVTRSKWKPEDYRNKRFAEGWQETTDIPGWGKFLEFFVVL